MTAVPVSDVITYLLQELFKKVQDSIKKITSVSLVTYVIYLISIDDMIKNKTF